MSSEGLPYPIFAYSALIFWTFFASSVSQGTIAMTANAALVRKIYFPRETLLIAVLISAFLDLLIAAIVLAAMFVYYHTPFTLTFFWLVPLLILQLLWTLTVILITSAVHVYFRDIGHALPLLLQLWMFATPVAYALSSVPAWLKPVYMLNPMTGLIDGYRRALLQDSHPDFTFLSIAFVLTAFALLVAYSLFKRAERTFADVI